ncbi:melanotransferrin [Nephila pilipes]|uniref:Melanotransferrin n=1 Tax=Nephila pilipes TaxID=299642 RepID=A0A8X6UG08_NEPPI|nr:melanotransferrin [Nephila pilipes]
MLWILVALFAVVHAAPLRICVPESLAVSCGQMEKDLPDVFKCVVAPDTFECVRKVNEREADVTNVDPAGLYLGGKFYNLQAVVMELVDGEPFRYQGIALVQKGSDIQSANDLRNRTSCHTGLRRTVGWQIPVGKLLDTGIMPASCDEGEIAAVSNFFSGSCVPGNWSTDPEVDSRLKAKYHKLCSRCKNPETCSVEDVYAGYQGVMNCLSEGAADVAFTKIPELKLYLQKHPEFKEKAEFLCFDGGRKSLEDPNPCIWGVRPTNARQRSAVALDGGDVYKAGKYYGLQPIASELYNGSDATYYSVAVLRSVSDVTKLSDLRGLRSCHTGMGRTAGWVMPVGVLISEGLLQESNCNHAEAVADFFSSGSCVPGANDSKTNPGRVRNEDLCKHCIGDEQGQHKCARDSRERYSGYAGAFRCLAEGRGDVAFVKHKTVPDYTDGHGKEEWTKDLLSSDFQLLCDGGGTSSVQNYKQCNLGKVPAHQVVTNERLSTTRRLMLARLLADTSRYFSDTSKLYRLFRQGDLPDLLFKDSATGLRINPLDSNYEQVLGQRFLEASRAADPKNCS